MYKCHLSIEWYSHVTIYSEHDRMTVRHSNAVAENLTGQKLWEAEYN